MGEPINILQLTDPHLGASHDECLAGINTRQSFAAAIQTALNICPQPDLFAFTGDIASHANTDAYKIFEDMVGTLPGDKLWLPGNHDNIDIMKQTLSFRAYQPIICKDDWVIVSVNSAQKGKVGGHITESELAHIEQTLKYYKHKHIILFLHHPLLPLGSNWLDKQRVDNAQAFFDIVDKHTTLKAVFTGHGHQEAEVQQNQLTYYTSPSTCMQFVANSHDFGISDHPPGFRHIQLFKDGTLSSKVHWLHDYPQKPDQRLKGY